MPGRSAIAHAVLDTIATMREAGVLYADIAAATGVPAKNCQYHALRMGASAPVVNRVRNLPAQYVRSGQIVRAFTPAEDAAIVRWDIEGHVTLHEMGRRLGRKHNAVLQRLRALARRDELEAAQCQ